MTLYRTFPKAEYADDFMNGKIFISTLKRCREIEDGIGGDFGEGSVTYHSGSVDGSDPAALRFILRRAGLPGIGGNVNFYNNTSFDRVPNAFILCLTRRLAPKFGEHV